MDIDTSSFHRFLFHKSKREAKYIGQGLHANDVGICTGTKSVCEMLSSDCYYFEVTIVNRGAKGDITIGLCRGPPPVKIAYGINGMKGYGVHIDEGETTAMKLENNLKPFITGDVIGCGIHISTMKVFFSVNGKVIDNSTGPYVDLFTLTDVSLKALYPFVQLHSANEEVFINFGGERDEPFLMDVDKFLKQEAISFHDMIDAEVESIPPATINALIKSYFIHKGYRDSYEAMESAVEQVVAVGGKAQTEAEENLPSAMETVESVSTNVYDSGDLVMKEGSRNARLEERARLRGAITEGSLDTAFKLLASFFPANHQDNDLYTDAMLVLHCQQFCDIVAQGDVALSVKFVQETLSRYHAPALNTAERNAILMDHLALLAYQNPSPQLQAHRLLDKSHRYITSHTVNELVLEFIASTGDSNNGTPTPATAGFTTPKIAAGPGKVSLKCPLDILIRHLVASGDLIRESKGAAKVQEFA